MDTTGKAIGLIRNIDTMGRVVIPKEYRKVMGVAEGDELEMFLYENGIFIRRRGADAESEAE